MKRFTLCLCVALLCLAACTTHPTLSSLPPDQIPMFGGMDRSAPELQASDKKFIREVTQTFGTRQAASIAWVQQGFWWLNRKKPEMAMRRFNQAWLLDADNPGVYWGFASILNERSQYCQGLEMIELGMTKGTLPPGALPDAALLYATCGRENSALSSQERKRYFAKSEEMFVRAYADPTLSRERILRDWARALYVREDYALAWIKVREYEDIRRQAFDENFLKNLRAKMPEPAK